MRREKIGLSDYKFYCFNGVPEILMIVKDRGAQTKAAYFDMEFRRLHFTRGFSVVEGELEKPRNFDLMRKFARILSQGTVHLRVDFYESGGRLYFGELTFFPASGFVQFEPKSWDEKLGDLLQLPQKKNNLRSAK